MKALLISAHRRGSLIDLWVRDEDNQKRQITIDDFQPYFYVAGDYGEFKGIYGESLTKVYTKDPSQVRKERENYEQSWEADILFTRRFLVDKKIYKGIEFPDNQQYVSQNDVKLCKVDIEPLILFLDIEVLQGEGFPTAEEAKQPVISFSFKTSRNNKYFTYILQEGESKVEYEGDNIIVYIESERDLLYAFSEIIEKIQPDIITGWNIIDFDFTYLKNRFKRLDLQWTDERPFELFDMLQGYKKIFSQPSYALKRVAEIEEIDKKENIETFKQVIGYYQTDIKRFAEYNRRDVEYVYEIDKKHSLIEYYLNLKWLAGVESIQKTLSVSVLIDTMLLRIARKRNIILPTTKESEKIDYKGGYVFSGEKGLYNDVAVLDFSGYYPNIVLNFNLSPEITENTKDSGIGIIPELIKQMLKEKNKVTEQMNSAQSGSQEHKVLYLKREAIKVMTNAPYGVLGYTGFRFYNPKLAAKITGFGREGTEYLITLGEKYRYKVLLADTDSIFIQIPFEKAEKLCSTLEHEIHNFFWEKYSTKIDLNLEFQMYLKKLLRTDAKKRYAMRVGYNKGECDYIVIKGFEAIRTDQSIFTRNLLTDLLKLVLYDSGKNEIKKFIQDKLSEFPNRPLTEIGINRGINKKFSDYKANTPHVRGALWSNSNLNTNFKYGDKVQFLWVKGIQGYPPTNVICFNEDTELPEGIVVDWKHMRDVGIIDKVTPILEVIDISLESNNKQATF